MALTPSFLLDQPVVSTMKKPAFYLLASVFAATAALSLPACTRDAVSSESRASSPEAAEFNQQTSENSRTEQEAKDSVAAAAKVRRPARP